MRVLLVEALERTHTGVFVPPGTSRQALEFIQIVKDAFLAERVDDAVYVHVRCIGPVLRGRCNKTECRRGCVGV